MNLRKLLFGSRKNHRLAAVAKDVAGRSCAAVWGRVQHKSLAMSDAEARGYIRAQSATAISHEVDAALRRHSEVPAAMREQLVDAAKAALVDMLLAEIQRVRKTTVPHRRAA